MSVRLSRANSVDHRLDIVLEAERILVRLVRELDLTIGVNEELMEVPLDIRACHLGGTDAELAHPSPGGVSIFAVDVGLLNNGESDSVLGLELDDVVSRAGLLVVELVARVGDNLEAVILVFGVDLN